MLDERQIPYRWVDIDQDHEGEKYVLQANHGSRSIPTIVFGDGVVLVEPSNAELSAKLFKTRLE
ncbi:MAG: NrdH-redoxin [Anaerolineae bacterium CG_4_9_14_3_um_filter_57_17]|nr:MAG: NrdH-redoxin [Anaerolineae bacterium CG_4_9_14_3_um_filter_57_17]